MKTLGTAKSRRRKTKPLVQRILVPTDFSAPAREALHYAHRLAARFGAEVILLHVLEQTPPLASSFDVPALIDDVEDRLQIAEKNLRALSASLEVELLHVGTTVREGVVLREIVAAAHEWDADLIVIATHGYTGWKRFLLGSTAESVVRTAPCPVLVVREKEHDLGPHFSP